MSALSDIREKDFDALTKTEKCIVEVWEMQGLEWMAEEAATEQATLRAELATAKARAKTAEENWHKNEARVAKLLESIKAAQVELHATQRNWDEECLFECNDILTAALKGVA